MAHPVPCALAAVAVVAAAGVATAGPPRPAADNGLTRNETATLWSRDDDTYISEQAYRAAYGRARTPLEQLANGTDITFTRPPATATRWTRADHREFPPGDRTTAVGPPHATRRNGTYIRGAHATVFAIRPATVVHAAPGARTRYVAPSGTLRGVVDYRMRVPPDDTTGNTTVDYQVRHHAIQNTTLRANGRVVATGGGSHRPALSYTLPGGPTTLQLTATITATIEAEHTETEWHNETLPNGTVVRRPHEETWTERHSETLTVTDRRRVHVYAPTVRLATAIRPNGVRLLAAFHRQPWQGLRLSPDGHRRVRGVWRFFTARDPRWDQLVRRRGDTDERIQSPARPVVVHAYPSRLGPRTEPTGRTPRLTHVWGRQRATPAPALPAGVHVDVVEAPYTASSGVAVVTAATPQTVQPVGIVRGTDIAVRRAREPTHLQTPELTVTVLEQDTATATLCVELTDASTGAPITLERVPAPFPRPPGAGRDGYVTIAGQRVRTNASGMATVTVAEPGVYTARYVPGAWLTHEPAYVGTTATARWHPLTQPQTWLSFVGAALRWSLPILVAVYAGLRLGRLVALAGRWQR